jgi:predicted nuclease of predicted toxin-antitoxin system
MKLLLDQKLLFRLVKKLELIFPGSAHFRLLGMEKQDDRVIWQYARGHGFTIVTQAADFELLTQLYGFPPKVIWLRCGNTATTNILQLLTTHKDLIQAFTIDEPVSCLELR